MTKKRTFYVIARPYGFQPPYVGHPVHGGWSPEYALRFDSYVDAARETLFLNMENAGHKVKAVTISERSLNTKERGTVGLLFSSGVFKL